MCVTEFYQVPDFLNAKINGIPVKEVIKDTKWLEEEFTEMVQKVRSSAKSRLIMKQLLTSIAKSSKCHFSERWCAYSEVGKILRCINCRLSR